jgi:hypothetical protein
MLRHERCESSRSEAAISGHTFAADEPGIPAAAAPVYHDRHETSLPLLLLGAVITISMGVQLGSPDGRIGPIEDWQTAMALTVGFAVLWLIFRRRADRAGLRRPPGFFIATIIGLALILTPLAIALFYAGPFAVLGPGLLTAGVRLHNRFLAIWAAVVGSIGILEGFFGITNRLPMSVWADWEHPAIFLALGILTVVAGIVMRVRENQAGSGDPA